MTMKLQLDRAALQSLFPPGSEAEVELRRVVTTELVKRLTVKDVNRLSADVVEQIDLTARKALIDFGLIPDRWHDKWTLSQGAAKTLKVHVEHQIISLVDKAVADASAQITEQAHLRVQQHLDRVIDTGVTGRIKDIFRSMFAQLH